MSSRMGDPAFTLLAATAAALAVSLASHGLRWGSRVMRCAKRMITQIDWRRPVTLEIIVSLRIQPGNQVPGASRTIADERRVEIDPAADQPSQSTGGDAAQTSAAHETA